MAFCSKCGSAVTEGAVFCNVCGSPVSASGGQATPPLPPPPQTGAASTGMSSNVAGALSYLIGPVTGIIFLVLEPYNRDKFVRFHAFQSIGFSVAAFILQIVWSIFVSAGFRSLGLPWSDW